jgi:glycosyltransferase EpsH
MNPKVSILVPVYNMESYLPRCLDSLRSQTLTDIEIIAVNDGSTDNSLQILKAYARTDCRIIVVDRCNGGVSAARNEAIRLARGEYIGFVDPDDWVEQDMYSVLYEAAVSENADVVMCSYVREFGTHSKVKEFRMPDKITYTGERVRSVVLRRLVGPLGEEVRNPEYLDAWGTVWSKLYRTSVIKNNNVRFVDLNIVGSNEDSLFNMQVMCHAETFTFVNRPLYHYWRANPDSITSRHKPELVRQFMRQYAWIQDFLTTNRLQPEFYHALQNRIALNILGLGLSVVSKRNPASSSQKVKALRELLEEPLFRSSLERFDLSLVSHVWKWFFLCAKWRCSAGLYVMLLGIDWLRKRRR